MCVQPLPVQKSGRGASAFETLGAEFRLIKKITVSFDLGALVSKCNPWVRVRCIFSPFFFNGGEGGGVDGMKGEFFFYHY